MTVPPARLQQRQETLLCGSTVPLAQKEALGFSAHAPPVPLQSTQVRVCREVDKPQRHLVVLNNHWHSHGISQLGLRIRSAGTAGVQ
jgi:hypothetical protein